MYIRGDGELIFIESLTVDKKIVAIKNSSYILHFYYEDEYNAELAFRIILEEIQKGTKVLDMYSIYFIEKIARFNRETRIWEKQAHL